RRPPRTRSSTATSSTPSASARPSSARSPPGSGSERRVRECESAKVALRTFASHAALSHSRTLALSHFRTFALSHSRTSMRHTTCLTTFALLAALVAAEAPEVEAQRGPERPRRGWIGISLRTLDDRGAVVEGVSRESPAERAGIEEGDTIVRWNGSADVEE